jgi:hypothetical protein
MAKFNFDFDENLKQEVKNWSLQEKRSISAEINVLLKEALEAREQEESK